MINSKRRRFALRQVTILPLMALVIVLFAQVAQRTSGEAEDTPPLTDLLVVANLRDESLTVIDFSGGPGVARVLGLPGAPHELAAVGGRLYTTLPRQHLLLEVEPRAPAILRALSLQGMPHGLARTPDGRTLAIGLEAAATIALVDVAGLGVRGLLSTDPVPHFVAYDSDAVLFVASAEHHVVWALGPGEPRVGAAGRVPEGLAVAGDYLVSADAGSGTLTVFDRRSLASLRTIQVGGQPVRVVPLGDGTVAAALNDTGRVVVVSPADGKVVRRLAVRPRPDGLCVSPDGAYLAVASNAEDAVEVFHIGVWHKVGEAPAGVGPGACAWLPR